MDDDILRHRRADTHPRRVEAKDFTVLNRDSPIIVQLLHVLLSISQQSNGRAEKSSRAPSTSTTSISACRTAATLANDRMDGQFLPERLPDFDSREMMSTKCSAALPLYNNW